MNKIIEIVPYDANWPNIFKAEAALIKEALGDNCIEIHHVGSTSVPGLSAKPIIDMIPVVRDIMLVDTANPKMAALGYEIKGEFGMLFRRYFKKIVANIHVYEKGSGEIDRCIKFRDWMCAHKTDQDEYAQLKKALAEKYPHDILSYCFGKDAFIAAIDKRTGFSGLRVVKALTPAEWNSAKNFRDNYFLSPYDIADSSTYDKAWSDKYMNHEQNAHLVLYQGADIVAYAHIQFWPNKSAAIRIIAVDENKRNQNSGSKFLTLIEKWLKSLGIKSIHAESRQASLKFYLKNGYCSMPFDDPAQQTEVLQKRRLEGHEPDPNDVAVGKLL
jgi:GrpB-like predicted nucleotidyltransferase (UPF0157 family)/N-acetylglutamate synthase-like GNAT family acetyltransferase